MGAGYPNDPGRWVGRERPLAALGYFEPSLTHQLLPGCSCGSPHPIALRSTNPTVCPGCGMPVQPPSALRTDRAVLAGLSPLMLAGRLFLWLGRILAQLARSI